MEGMQDAPMEQVIPNSRSADGFLCIHYSIDRNVEARQLTYESSPATVNFPRAAPVRSGRTWPSCKSGAFTTRTAMRITLLLRNSRRLNLGAETWIGRFGSRERAIAQRTQLPCAGLW